MSEATASDEIEVTLNGEARGVPAGLSLTGLLEHLDQDPAAVVVERNREIVRGDDRDETEVRAGDEIEIVHFVGGG
ncbi:MAG: sulfur carrier protein ThiS [Candidatus Palauibacterales bacterium]|nr:sulfur carrier protein ThiS [Candidatus Palauibacterales bacterium]